MILGNPILDAVVSSSSLTAVPQNSPKLPCYVNHIHCNKYVFKYFKRTISYFTGRVAEVREDGIERQSNSIRMLKGFFLGYFP